MRHIPAAALVLCASLCASAASAGPLDFLAGIPDAPGVVRGGSYGPSGNDYYGDMHFGGSHFGGSRRAALPSRQARAKVHPVAREKRVPRT